MNANELQHKAIEAASRFLVRHEYNIIEKDWHGEAGGHIDIVAEEGDTIVFVDVDAREGCDKGFIERGEHDRARMETDAAKWLSEHVDDTYIDRAVRLDTISLMVVGKDRAFMRHHVGAFSANVA